MKQLLLNVIMPTEKPALENFYVGPNRQVISHLQQLIGAKKKQFSITYIWGEACSGKTFLLQSVANAFTNTGWLDSAQLPASYNAQWQLICIDDIDRLAAQHQQEAFSWLVQAQTDAMPVLIAGRVPPSDLPLREDLRTRVGWGEIFRLQPLDDAHLTSWLRYQATSKGIELSAEVVQYMVLHLPRNLAYLKQLLQHLDKASLEQHRLITIPFLKQQLEHLDYETGFV